MRVFDYLKIDISRKFLHFVGAALAANNVP